MDWNDEGPLDIPSRNEKRERPHVLNAGNPKDGVKTTYKVMQKKL
jgi:hypothetical protein